MKILTLATLGVAMLLTACTTTNNTTEPEPMIGMANPASEFCVKQGGKLEPRKDKDGGEYAMCHLPNGQVVEEWDYFRKHSK
ncbi:DUF333 domain-containing protein [Moraxella sp. FZLJ2107]|uniref:putative hemolysin n=1 Tax=unclassified Moraxella TaxID=2685852 RepID=UPI0020C915F0|nr:MULTISPECIES: DUF333 domain-containing protein [unclassified Moraxella]UTO05134.1 DUF333 domain-containing protein [Moraxella sp. FZLJ2107]UTO21869.1 DUF333 domain-containing protein [Moraxella sp. FZLJ2109]